MAVPRFFLAEQLGGTDQTVPLPLTEADMHHAVSVLRLKSGDEIELVEPGSNQALRVVLTSVDTAALRGDVVGRIDGAYGPDVTLVQGVAKGDKMDDIVRHAVEIGAVRILPALTERTVVRLSETKAADKGDRWRRIARAAAEQSHRNEVPGVADPVPLSHLVEPLSRFDRVVVLWEDADGGSLEEALGPWFPGSRPSVAVVIGPEGGFSASEVASLQEVGGRVASLGKGILRTETAALAALTLTVHHFGGLGRA